MRAYRHTWSVTAFLPWLFALAIGALIAIGAPSATAMDTALQANSVVLEDSTGEDANALDIGTVTVSNDDTGLVTFDTKFVNGGISAATTRFYVVLDTDRNEATGSPNTGGGDWFIGWAGSPALFKWNGTDWDFAPSMKTLVTSVQPNGLVVKVHPSEFGNVTGFDFYSKTYRPDPNDPENEFSDWAPERGMWSYDIKIYVAPVLDATAVKCIPDPPKAGKPMVARTTVTVMRGGTSEQLGSAATVRATATIAGKKIAGTVLPSYPTGKVAVRWLLPKTAKGKVMRGTITVTLEKVSVTRTFVDHIK